MRESFVEELVDQFMTRDENKPHEPGLRAIVQVYRTAAEEGRKVEESAELTELGKREAMKRSLSTAYASLKPHEKAVEHLADKLAATRSKALRRPEATRETLAVEREIRDRLVAAKADPVTVSARYFSAIDRGDNAFVGAVENAPASFPLLSSMDREKGEAAKLEQSPLAYLIAEQEAEFDLFDQIIRMTETQLGKLEGRH